MNGCLYCFLIVFAEIASKTFLVKTVDKLISKKDSGEHGSDYVLDMLKKVRGGGITTWLAKNENI